MNSSVMTAVMVLALALPSVRARCEVLEKEFGETFPAPAGTVLRLRHGDGDVILRPWDRDEIEILVRYRADRKGLGELSEDDFTVDFRSRDGAVEVTGREKGSGFFGLSVYVVKEYSYTISAPPGTAVDLDGDDGSIEVERWRGDIEIRSDDGSIELVECSSRSTTIRCEDSDIAIDGHSGSLDIDADDAEILISRGRFDGCRIVLEDGDVRIRDSEGDIEVVAEDADTELYRISSSRLDLESEDGGFDVDLLGGGPASVEIRTGDGDVELGLRGGVSARVSVDTGDGRIRVDLPGASDVREGGGWWSGTIGKGLGDIKIRTADGSVSIRELR